MEGARGSRYRTVTRLLTTQLNELTPVTWPLMVHMHRPRGRVCATCGAFPYAGIETTVTFLPARGVRALRQAVYDACGVPEDLQDLIAVCRARIFVMHPAFDLAHFIQTNHTQAGCGAYFAVSVRAPPADCDTPETLDGDDAAESKTEGMSIDTETDVARLNLWQGMPPLAELMESEKIPWLDAEVIKRFPQWEPLGAFATLIQQEEPHFLLVLVVDPAVKWTGASRAPPYIRSLFQPCKKDSYIAPPALLLLGESDEREVLEEAAARLGPDIAPRAHVLEFGNEGIYIAHTGAPVQIVRRADVYAVLNGASDAAPDWAQAALVPFLRRLTSLAIRNARKKHLTDAISLSHKRASFREDGHVAALPEGRAEADRQQLERLKTWGTPEPGITTLHRGPLIVTALLRPHARDLIESIPNAVPVPAEIYGVGRSDNAVVAILEAIPANPGAYEAMTALSSRSDVVNMIDEGAVYAPLADRLLREMGFWFMPMSYNARREDAFHTAASINDRMVGAALLTLVAKAVPFHVPVHPTLQISTLMIPTAQPNNMRLQRNAATVAQVAEAIQARRVQRREPLEVPEEANAA